MTARFFLGVGEASIAPGFALITGMFYKREEQPARQAAWFIGNSFANIIGGVVAYGIGKIHNSGVNSWQLIFLILGAVTASYALILFAFLPDSPAKVFFFSKTERAIAVQRTLENKTGVLDTGKFKWNQVRMALKDPQTWLLVLYTLCVNFCNGGLTSFAAIIITGFGFSTFNALLIQMPIGGAQIFFLICTSAIATFVRSTRILMMILNTAVSMIGMIMIWKLDDDNRAGKMTGLCFGAVFAANIPLALSLITSNVAGFTKKSVVSALMFIAYCVGNIVGPQFFLASEDPHYPVSVLSLLTSKALAANLFADWDQSFYVWSHLGYLFPHLPICLLRLGEPAPRPTIRLTATIDGDGRVARRAVRQNGSGNREFPICILKLIV